LNDISRESDRAVDTIRNILSAGINCPPPEVLLAFGTILNISTDRLIEVAESDGCEYSAEESGLMLMLDIKSAQFKKFDFYIKELGEGSDEGEFEGIISVFGNMDDGYDIVEPGSFLETISDPFNLKRIKGLWQHDSSQPPIGQTINIKEISRNDLPPHVISQAPDASGGLWLHGKILPTTLGNDVLIGMRAGVVNEMSFAYNVLDWSNSANDDGYYIRHLTKLKLFEWSPVNWGMNSATHIGNVKALNSRIKHLLRCQHKRCSDSDNVNVSAVRTVNLLRMKRLNLELQLMEDYNV